MSGQDYPAYRINSKSAQKKKSRQPTVVGQVLSQALKNYGLEQDLARYQFVLHWKDIVGAEVAKRTKPETLRNGRLTIKVSDSAWAQELSFQAPLIIKQLQKHLSEGQLVKELFFRVGR